MSTDKKPIQLISFDSDRKLQVNAEAIKWLSQANQNKPIGVITVVGKYRTGKSYLLNRVLLGKNSGFEVGPTINACTKGLWVWPELIQSPDDSSTQFLVMDTEGLGSLEEGEQTDTKIFLMAMLLSSYFIYNSVGNIDEKAVQSLSLIINLSKLLQKGGDKEVQDILNCFPSFLWLVRDFALRLEDQSGIPITPKQYLDNGLKLQAGNSEMTVRKNSVRKQLINFFRDRDCFMLIRPVDDEKKLQNMSKVKDSQLRPQFVSLVNQLQSKIFKNAKSKTFKGRPCSPVMFIELCQHFCQSINQGGLPEIESNWDLVCKAQSSRIEKRCLVQFEEFLGKYENLSCDKLDIKSIEEQVYQKILNLVKCYEKGVFGNKEQKKRIFKEKLQKQFVNVKKTLYQLKNHEIQQNFQRINIKVQELINGKDLNSIFDLTQQYDQLVEEQTKRGNFQTLTLVYKHCYQGLKKSALAFFGASMQNQKFEQNVLTEKLNLYQNSFTKIHNEQHKKNEQCQNRQRELRKNVFQLDLKAKQALKQLQNAKKQLQNVRNQYFGKQNVVQL